MSVHFVTCPNCGTEFNAERKFCPNCHLPRSRVAAELRRASEQTGIPFNDLVLRAWEEERNPPPDLPDREPISAEVDPEAIRRKNMRWLGAIGAVVFACVVLAIIGVLLDPDTKTEAEEPSRGQSSRSSSDNSLSESEYFSEMSDVSYAMAESMDRFTVLTSDPQFLNPTWIVSAHDELDTWRESYRKVRAIDPPSRFDDLHDSYLEAFEHYYAAARLIGQGIDNINSQKIAAGTTEFDEGNRLVTQINDEIDDLE